MRYEILGPLRVHNGTHFATVGARKVEALLAVLVIRADQIVPAAALMAEIWGESLPRRATACLHVYVSQLRKFLGQSPRADGPIVTRAPGYLLGLGSDEVDLHAFLRLMCEGRRHETEGRYREASTAFEKALALCRGPVLGDLRLGPVLSGFAAWAEETRLECLELLMESKLLSGCHREVVGELYSLTSQYPHRETFYRQLMLALFRSERQADALTVYQAARNTLNAELGLEPGRPLRELQHAILTADERLTLPGPALLSIVEPEHLPAF